MGRPLRVGRVRFVGLLAVGLAAVAALPAGAKVPGPNGQIVFGNDNKVYTANPDGSNPQLLEENACCASWSPDGNLIALSGDNGDGRITTATVSPTGAGYTLLPLPDSTLNLGPGALNSWTPDGKRFVLQGWDDTDPSRDGVYTVSTDGSGLVRVTTNPYGSNDVPEDVSPDGMQIVFSREDPNRHDRFATFVVSVNGGPVLQIGGWQRVLDTASWSPDGQWILTDNGQGGLYVVHPDGTGRHQIPLAVPSQAFAFTPSWSPDGTKIVFGLFTARGKGTGQEAIYTANADGSDLQSTGLQGDSPDWGPYPITP
jgi:Tol biopolymer transport system component